MKNKKILVGITGGIAAYKICSLINMFFKEGADIKVVMTPAATEFVSSLTFQTLTNHAVYVDMFEIINKEEVEHISLANWADIMLIAPATANTIGKIAHGIADNLLTTIVMALPVETTVVMAPAMNSRMWDNPIMQKNVEILKEQKNKYIFVPPREGILACRYEGKGKIAENEDILVVVKKTLVENE